MPSIPPRHVVDVVLELFDRPFLRLLLDLRVVDHRFGASPGPLLRRMSLSRLGALAVEFVVDLEDSGLGLFATRGLPYLLIDIHTKCDLVMKQSSPLCLTMLIKGQLGASLGE